MFAQPTQPIHQNDPAHQSHPGQQAVDAHGYHQVLHDLINMGTDLARLLHGQAAAQAAQQAAQQATGQPAPPPAPDALISIAAAFDRIARAVRRSIALARSLDAIQPANDPAQHRAAARKRILRAVEDSIQRTAQDDGPGSAEAEALAAELHDRLDAPDLDDDIGSRPVADIITEICRDLGLAALPGTTPWKRRTPADIEQLCARAAAASRPRPQNPLQGASQPPPGPPSPGPAAIPRARSALIHAGNSPPEDAADEIATVLRHPARPRGQWPPPPGA